MPNTASTMSSLRSECAGFFLEWRSSRSAARLIGKSLIEHHCLCRTVRLHTDGSCSFRLRRWSGLMGCTAHTNFNSRRRQARAPGRSTSCSGASVLWVQMSLWLDDWVEGVGGQTLDICVSVFVFTDQVKEKILNKKNRKYWVFFLDESQFSSSEEELEQPKCETLDS